MVGANNGEEMRESTPEERQARDRDVRVAGVQADIDRMQGEMKRLGIIPTTFKEKIQIGAVFAVVILLLVFFVSRSRDRKIEIDANGTMRITFVTGWGFSTEERPLRWHDGEWQVQRFSGEWESLYFPEPGPRERP